MIFILHGSLMNGTVFMNTDIKGIEASTFKEAIKKVQNLKNMKNALKLKVSDNMISFYFDGEFKNYYTMTDTPLKIIE
jgi:hypothetical protein